MDETPTIGARIRALRKERRLKQAVVAEAVGIERASLSMLENGHDLPGRHTLRAIADYFAVTVDYLERGAPILGFENAADASQSIEEAELLAIWRKLSDADRHAIVALMERLVGVVRAVEAVHAADSEKSAGKPQL
jgi:transcriptional regulator with XRE-family HTH domain